MWKIFASSPLSMPGIDLSLHKNKSHARCRSSKFRRTLRSLPRAATRGTAGRGWAWLGVAIGTALAGQGRRGKARHGKARGDRRCSSLIYVIAWV